ncbi:retinal cone rhodopsin-sensitive cGMP 3',5'-cyclic phosphodiesterase subunit gamma-like isoform X2 [Syngnathoides biaculeatus]|uniref:retinal cone rhodopsin-sensitive cGMP 3',5'-cyclic phosphodiesterase subunit gamma-like isoform X2 n=2 Tax=Syngnathoides biaculeatus TaxID=300417 RepID=UPI002ADDFFCE|nr:retinal cone rhodopsin-sensitive cGMP 3',5'-cyclic phosphodiesterase subunit gamma-like isoform X2 [Syngnathoides biaculeatus]
MLPAPRSEMNAGSAEPKSANANLPKPKEKEMRLFKSKVPKAGQKRFDEVPGMDGIGDAEVVCPWEAFGEMDLSDLAQFGIV